MIRSGVRKFCIFASKRSNFLASQSLSYFESHTRNSQMDYLYKILLIGDSGVGKSSLGLQFTEGNFKEEHIINGMERKTKLIQLDDKSIMLHLWETAGWENILTKCYRGKDGIVVVYDVSNKDSFDHAQGCFHEIEKYSRGNPSRLLIGNKCDLESQRKVEFSEGQNLANQLVIPFIETSAKDNFNVEQAFVTMAAVIKSRSAKDSPETG